MMDIQPQIIRGTNNVTRRYVEPTAAMMAGCLHITQLCAPCLAVLICPFDPDWILSGRSNATETPQRSEDSESPATWRGNSPHC